MKSKKILTKVLFLCLLLLFPISCFASSSISFNSSWKYANESKIHSGSATLYEATSNSNGYTVTVNAGHGTSGGCSVKTLAHPDGSPKLIGGSCQAGQKECCAITDGMTFNDRASEASVTLQMAKILKDKLLANGYNVLMIRESNGMQLDNIARTVIANNNSDIHIALHWDSTESDKGVFYMSVPKISSYINMEPVKSHYKEHEELGESLIEGLKSKGVKIFSSGKLENDLIQTSFSTIPSVDIELGDKASDHSTSSLNTLGDGLLEGINKFFDVTGITPGQNQSGGGSTNSTTLNLSDYSLTSEQKSKLEEAMKSWPSEMEKGRVEIIKKGLSLIGKGIIYPRKDANGNYIDDNSSITTVPPAYLDCSAYVSWVFYQAGFNVGQKCTDNFPADTDNFVSISKEEMLPGDIALNATGGGCSEHSNNHVGIYFGTVNGQNIYLNSTKRDGVSGPQFRYGEVNFKVYYRYKKFGDEMTSIDSSSGSSSGSSGLSGNIPTGLQEDPYEDNGFGYTETKDITCKNIFMKEDGSDELNDLGEAVQGLFTLIKIATPILVLILTTIDYIKAMTNQDDAEIKKTTQRTFKRLIFGILIFLLPFLLDLIFHLLGLYDLSTCGIGGTEEVIVDPGEAIVDSED